MPLATIPEMNDLEIPILNLTCHFKQNNSDALPGFGVLLEFFRNNIQLGYRNETSLVKSNTTYYRKEVPQ